MPKSLSDIRRIIMGDELLQQLKRDGIQKIGHAPQCSLFVDRPATWHIGRAAERIHGMIEDHDLDRLESQGFVMKHEFIYHPTHWRIFEAGEVDRPYVRFRDWIASPSTSDAYDWARLQNFPGFVDDDDPCEQCDDTVVIPGTVEEFLAAQDRASQARPHCATCGSSDPMLHPALQSGGEVSICRDSFHPRTQHTISDDEIEEMKVAAARLHALCTDAYATSLVTDPALSDWAKRAQYNARMKLAEYVNKRLGHSSGSSL